MSTLKVDKLVAAYVNCRNALNAKRKGFQEIEKAYKKDMEIIADKLKAMLDEMGVDSFKTEFGTAFKKKTDGINVADWDATLQYILKYNLTHMLQRSVSKVAVKEFMNENEGRLPPGLDYFVKTEVQVRSGK